MKWVIVILIVIYSFAIYRFEVSHQIRQINYWNSVPVGDLEFYEEPNKITFTLAFILNPISWVFYWIHLLINKIMSERVD